MSNSYNKGKVTGTENVGAIAGNAYSTENINNVYYLKDSYIKGTGDLEESTIAGKATKIDKDFASLEDFLNWVREN